VPADEPPVEDVDADEWARFLARLAAVEQQDLDEPGRWASFFERLRRWLGVVDPDESPD
jgi:hypothetical protein